MAIKQKIDSNATGLRYQEETSIGVANVANNWIPLEPNSYDNFGGEVKTVPRAPINAGRQNAKGVTTDLDAAGGFNTDLTQSNLQDLLQGFFFADFRAKVEFGGAGEITGVDATLDDFAGTGVETGYAVGDLVFAAGFTDAANNGIHEVDAVASNLLGVSTALVTETPGAGATLVRVGMKAAAGDIDVDASGTLPTLTSTTLDFTDLGVIPGEWIWIGGDAVGDKFLAAANNGFARVKTVTATVLTLDKTQATMTTEASTSETIELYVGRVLKNESDPTLQVRRTYQLERTLSAPDDTQPAQIQAEYLVGSVPNEITINSETADKISADLAFISTAHETIDGATALKTGTRPALVPENAINTSSDFTRLKMNIVDAADSNPSALFGFLLDFNIKIDNGATPNKAISTLGAFEVTAGNFTVSGDITAYFSEVAAVAAVQNNSDVTMDFAIVANNAGMVVDIPLIGLGDGRLNVEKDAPITLPLTNEAAADPVLDHTLLMVFFDYLPTAAAA
jgi:hypothetical protein